MKEWLTEEEQYKETLSNEEISRIQDSELREIRMKHWSYRRKKFLDENNISDERFCQLTDKDYLQEKRELEAYRNKHKK